MKSCSKCGETKDIGCFVKQAKAADGLFPWCEDCRKKYRKDKYNDNLQASREYNNRKRAIRIEWFQEIKSNTPCLDCGKIYEPYCMDYDHVPNKGAKIKNVSRMVLDHVSKEIILEEIKKCDIVCLLCHNKRTHNRLGEKRKYKPHQQRNIDLINEFKSKPCVICGQQYEFYNMQADHIDPSTKIYDVCQLKSRKVEILQAELNKCQILCALCHRTKSILEQQEKKYNIERPKSPKRQELFYDSESGIKECGLCHRTKKYVEFRSNRKTKSGLDTYCKECFNEYRRRIRQNSKKV